MVLKESRAEEMVGRWLNHQSFEVRKGSSVDIEAFIGDEVKYVVEVKGDQFRQSGALAGKVNPGALRNTFFMGLGQILIARCRHERIPVSLALTEMYAGLVNKFADVLRHHNVSILWVSTGGVRKDDLSTSRSSRHRSRVTAGGYQARISVPLQGRHGHPDGEFRCGRARFAVDHGHLEKISQSGGASMSSTLSTERRATGTIDSSISLARCSTPMGS
jgi:hypothetical protein